MTESPGRFTEVIITQMERCAKAFSDERGADFFERQTVFKNAAQTADNIRAYNAEVYFGGYIVRFCYYPHLPLTVSHSVLSCHVSLEKVEAARVFYPLSQIYGFLGICPESALTIPLILSGEEMKEAFDCLAGAFDKIAVKIRDLSYDAEGKAALFDGELDAGIAVFKNEFPTEDALSALAESARKDWYGQWKTERQDISDETELKAEFDAMLTRLLGDIRSMIYEDKRKFLDYYYGFITARAVSPAYEAYMTGNYAAAVKKLKKQRRKTAYEKLLIGYMQSAETPSPHLPGPIYKNLTELYKNGIPKNNLKEALAVGASMLICGIICLPGLLAVYFIFYLIEGIGAVYLLGSLQGAPAAIIPAMFCGLPVIYFNSKRFYKLFFKKDYSRLTALDSATNSRSTRRFMKVLAGIIIAGSLVFLALTAHQNIKLTDTGLYDNSAFWSIRGDYYAYDEIEKVYWRESTPGGENPGTPSYVILLKSGRELDPYWIETRDEKFLAALKAKGVQIQAPSARARKNDGISKIPGKGLAKPNPGNLEMEELFSEQRGRTRRAGSSALPRSREK